MKRSIRLALLLIPLLSALPAAAETAAETAADRCIGKVRLRGAIYDYQNGTLQPGLSEVLDALAKNFKERCPEKLLIIEAHAFEMPTPGLNQRLSELRAYSIRHELAQRGIPEAQTIPAPMGNSKPQVAVDSKDALEHNRRITFRVAD
jgi:outer membrane protein OmpA-like peptidoglycan-associated protein